MSEPITDGLTLLRALRDSGTPKKITDLGLPVVSENPHAPAELVLKALQDGGAKEGTLYKAQQLISTGKLVPDTAILDPLDALVLQRGEKIEPTTVSDQSVESMMFDPTGLKAEIEKVKAEAIEALKASAAELEAERKARHDAEHMLESLTKPKE